MRRLACVTSVSARVRREKLGQVQRKKEWRGRGRGKKETLARKRFLFCPPPSPSTFFFCSRAYVRAITRLETLAAQAMRRSKTSLLKYSLSDAVCVCFFSRSLQAMARVWRDGQKKTVYIYRLLTTVIALEYNFWTPKFKTFSWRTCPLRELKQPRRRVVRTAIHTHHAF